ncbi:acetyltransferase [Psychroserpens sp. SPM9]|uniref:acetyltransferase n=1 Tax=Psychroserpens sp. SPM9 TaxID=2975598 RepID=UPI0021A67C7A|nr:acetyltransferase [Psychroserpens sp. SPM9]MDG5492257.1 acetyltransferase [Psychroserpens sp. SPM9]
MKKLAIIGSGDLGQLMAYHAVQDKQFDVAGFFDDFQAKGSTVNHIKVLGAISDIETCYHQGDFDVIICGIGYKHLAFRERIFNQLHQKIKFANLIHSSCYVDASCNLGQGIFMLPGSVLDHNVTIEDNVVINIACVIAHDSTIGAHSFVSPRAAIAGFVTLGKRCNIGVNTTIIDNITIADDIQTGGGTIVITSLKNKGLYVGNPSRFIR